MSEDENLGSHSLAFTAPALNVWGRGWDLERLGLSNYGVRSGLELRWNQGEAMWWTKRTGGLWVCSLNGSGKPS